MKRIFIFLLAVTSNIMVCFSQGTGVKLDTIDNYSDWGWEALVVDNGYIQLVIIPELGGRVLFYGFPNDEYMWINPDQLGQVYDPDIDDYGPWAGSSGYGGYKVWPAPQDIWGWPPPPHLAWGTYVYVTEWESEDSVSIYLRSEQETEKSPGLVFARRYKMYRNSTLVKVEQILINNNTSAKNWSIWDVTQAAVSHEGDNDYDNFSVYFPANIGTISSNDKKSGNYSSLNVDVTKYNFVSGKSGKMFTFLNEGWVTFVDGRDEQTYAKVFEIFPDNDNHPDNNSNFEIYSSGSAYIEIEVLSPIETIGADGDSISYDEYWYAVKAKGIYGSNHAGTIQNELKYDDASNIITGDFGVHYNGNLRLVYKNSNGEELDSGDEISVNAADKFELNQSVTLPSGTASIHLVAYDLMDNPIGVIDSCIAGGISGINAQAGEGAMYIYPAILDKGESLQISLKGNSVQPLIEIFDLGSGRLMGTYRNEPAGDLCFVSTAGLESGVYMAVYKSSGSVQRGLFIIR
jgi:hypothetical protein